MLTPATFLEHLGIEQKSEFRKYNVVIWGFFVFVFVCLALFCFGSSFRYFPIAPKCTSRDAPEDRNKSAWFSSSVPPACQQFWILEGGSVAGWTTADYLFSQDATCPDTVRIYASKDYLWNQVVVFHSLFLSTCEQRRSVRSVCIGHYVLPPASVQEEVREVVGRLIWETGDEQHESESWRSQADDATTGGTSRSGSATSDTHSLQSEDSLCSHWNNSPHSDTCTGYISMDSLPKYSGDLCDYQPGCLRCFSCKAPCCAPRT